MRPLARALVVVVLAGSTVALCGPRPSTPAGHAGQGRLDPGRFTTGRLDPGRFTTGRLDPGRFTTRIDNPFWPMAPGSRWVYRETDGAGGGRRVEVTVTDRTVRVLGIEARVVRDVVFAHGRPREVTDDWFAQDLEGNLWQLGEVTRAPAGAEASTAGSWRAGVDGAEPVLVLPAHPDPGMVYRQPDALVRVLTAGTTAKVPYGSFRRLLVTQELGSPEAGQVEHEFYARGIGPVLAVTVSGGSRREELVGFDRARTGGTATGR